MSRRQSNRYKDSNDSQNELNERTSRRLTEKSLNRSNSMPNQNHLNTITDNRDELEVGNDQTYEEILERFNNQKQRMQESPEKGDVIKCTDSCIALEEEHYRVIPCDQNNQQAILGARDKERMISTKICDEGSNYIKETVVEQTHFTQEGLVIKTKHIIEKCGKDNDYKSPFANQYNDTVDNEFDTSNNESRQRSRSRNTDQNGYSRFSYSPDPINRENLDERENNPRPNYRRSTNSRDRSNDFPNPPTTRKSRLNDNPDEYDVEMTDFTNPATTRKSRFNDTVEEHDIDMTDCSKINQCQSMYDINTRRRPCLDSDICPANVTENSCCSNNPYEKNDDFSGCLKITSSCDCQDYMKGQQSSVCPDCVENSFTDDLTIQSSQSNSGLNRRESLSEKSLESSSKYADENLDDKIDSISIQLYSSNASTRSNSRSHEPPTNQSRSVPQTEVSKLLAEIILPNEYSRGVTIPGANFSEKENIGSGKTRKTSLHYEAQHKSVVTTTRNGRQQRKRYDSSDENIQNFSDQSDIEPNVNNTTNKRPTKYRRKSTIRDEDMDNNSHSDDYSQLDDETPPYGMEASAYSTTKKSVLHRNSEHLTEDNAKQNSKERPMKAFMIPLVYVAPPPQRCSRSCKCGENKPQFIQISGFQSISPEVRSPLSLQYRIVSDGDEDEDYNETIKRKSRIETVNRRRSTGGGKPFPPSAIKPFTISSSRPRYSKDLFVLYSSKFPLHKNHKSPQRANEGSSSISSQEESSSQSSDEEQSKSSSEVESSATSFLEAGQQSGRYSKSCNGNEPRRSSLKNQSTCCDIPSCRNTSSSENEPSLVAKRRCSPKFNLLAEVTLKDVNPRQFRTQGCCCPETCPCNSNSKCNLKPNDCLVSNPERSVQLKPCTSDEVSIRKRKKRSSVCDSEDFNKSGNSARQSCTETSTNLRNSCPEEKCTPPKQASCTCRCGCNKNDKECEEKLQERGTVKSDSNDSVNVTITSEINEKLDYYREEGRDDKNEVFQEENYRRSFVNITNVIGTSKKSGNENEQNNKNIMQNGCSDDTSSNSNDSDDSSTECENNDECCNRITEKCTQTEPCCCTCPLMMETPPPCNDYCCTEVNQQFGTTSGCDYPCFEPPPCNPDPMDCTYFPPNDEQLFCPCNPPCPPQNFSSSLPDECHAPPPTKKATNCNECLDDCCKQEEKKDVGTCSCCNEVNEKNTVPQNCCCNEKPQCECKKNCGEKCTQTEFSIQYFMGQQQNCNCNNFCCPPSCVQNSAPMTSQCVYQCFGQQVYHTECCSMNDQPVCPCNMPYTPQYQYPNAPTISNCQPSCSFPFQDNQQCCHPPYQQHTTNTMP